MLRRLVRITFAAAIATVFVLSLTSAPAPQASFGGGSCICPDVYAPVTCSNGVTYSNGCVASCHHATNCHPADTI